MNEHDCLFCKVIRREIGAKIIAENDRLIAFLDINPVAPVHALIVPKFHMANINDINQENSYYLGEIMLMAREIAQSYNINNTGYRLVVNNELSAQQSVFHLHVHILGGRDFSWPPG